MSRALIILGLMLVVLGLLWPVLGRLGLGRLPGDIHIQRPTFSVYFPLTTSILVSMVITIILWLANRQSRWSGRREP